MSDEQPEPSNNSSSSQPQTLLEIVKQIRSLYNADVALFSKEAIRNLKEQLKTISENSGNDQTVSITCMDGKIDCIKVRTGDTESTDGTLECVLGEPTIDYVSIQRLTENAWWMLFHQRYHTLRLVYPRILRDAATQEHHTLFTAGVSSDGAVRHLEDAVTTWEATRSYQQLRSLLLSPETPNNITKVIRFGCGGLLSNSLGWYQHALILTLKSILASRYYGITRNKIRCYAQDSGYIDADKRVLDESGIAVLDNPDGFLKVDDSSVVISFSPNWPVKQIVADIARPAILMWSMVSENAEEDRIKESTDADPDSKQVRALVRKFYYEFKFPGNDCPFPDIAIYVRRPGLMAPAGRS